MPPSKILKTSDGRLLVERFSPIRRAEHIFSIATFVMLVLTGFPQRFYNTAWAKWIIDILGGLGQTRSIHRIIGLVFIGHAVLHLTAIVVGAMSKRLRFTFLPTPQDLPDAWNNLRYYLGYRTEQPKFPKYDYRQKFEYVGLVLGGLLMIFTGLILLYPTTVASYLPGELMPAARVAHSNEALLALLVLVVWHVYGSHLSPEVFPMDKTVFTGYMPVEELEERHNLEFQRLFPNGIPKELLHGDSPNGEASEAPADGSPDDSADDSGDNSDDGTCGDNCASCASDSSEPDRPKDDSKAE